MEVFWMAIAIVTFIYGLFKVANEGFVGDNLLLLIFPFVAAALSLVRRRVRLKAKKQQEENQE